MKRPLLLACAAAATLFTASAAQASRVSWSIGINVPPVATVVAGDPYYAPAPVRYGPPAAFYPAPAPFYAPAPVVYDEPYVETVVAPRGYYAPVVVAPRGRYWAPPQRGYWAPRGGWDRHDHGHDDGHHRGHDDGHDRGHG